MRRRNPPQCSGVEWCTDGPPDAKKSSLTVQKTIRYVQKREINAGQESKIPADAQEIPSG
jgi:hypothetical protein